MKRLFALLIVLLSFTACVEEKEEKEVILEAPHEQIEVEAEAPDFEVESDDVDVEADIKITDSI